MPPASATQLLPSARAVTAATITLAVLLANVQASFGVMLALFLAGYVCVYVIGGAIYGVAHDFFFGGTKIP